jgi:hypothetical protein
MEGTMQRIEKIRKRRRFSTTHQKAGNGIGLRLGGVYALPNGKELIVGVGQEGHYFLYLPLVWRISAWIVSLPIEYEINAEGWIISSRGQPTSWRIEDLIDTDRTLDRV